MITEITVTVNSKEGNQKGTTRLLELGNPDGLTMEDIVVTISFLRDFIRDGRNVHETTDEDKTQNVEYAVMRDTDSALVSDLI